MAVYKDLSLRLLGNIKTLYCRIWLAIDSTAENKRTNEVGNERVLLKRLVKPGEARVKEDLYNMSDPSAIGVIEPYSPAGSQRHRLP